MATLMATQLDLVLQISILALLAVSMAFSWKKKMRYHGYTMVAAVVLNIISFAAVMGPAWDNVGEGSTGTLGVVGLAHVATGGLAFLLSILIAGVWVLSMLFFKPTDLPMFMRCYTQKSPMWITLLLWVTSLTLGIVLFLMLNTSILGSFPFLPNN
jgi:hypothetical protein